MIVRGLGAGFWGPGPGVEYLGSRIPGQVFGPHPRLRLGCSVSLELGDEMLGFGGGLPLLVGEVVSACLYGKWVMFLASPMAMFTPSAAQSRRDASWAEEALEEAQRSLRWGKSAGDAGAKATPGPKRMSGYGLRLDGSSGAGSIV